MKYIYYILSILFTLSLGSCKDDIPGSDNPNIGGITLTLTSGNMETRTNLTSTAATQNVESVYIALYKVNEDGVYDNATFVAAKDFGWEESSLTSYEKQTKTLKFDNLLAGEEYILLAVGLDADSETTYFTSLDDFNKKLETANTLANAKAIAANATSIATSELFAGWNTFTYEPDIENKVEVEMKRRVAGVLCYITDIPTTINDGTDKKVKKLRLSLYSGKKPNNQISLCRKNISSDGAGIELPDDFGEYSDKGASLTPTEEGYLILNEVDLLTTYGEQTGETYDIPEIKTEDLKVKANSLLLGNYVIPTKATEGNATLRVELLDENDKILVFFNAERVGVNDNTTYDIYPNYIYHIGQKLESNSTDDDQPVSLLGKKLTVVPQEWTTMPEVNVDFPSVPLVNGIELVNQDYIPYKEGYIFDCIGIDDDNNESYKDTYYLGAPYNERLYVKVTASVLKNKWCLKIIGNEVEEGILYFSQKNADGSYIYTTEYRGDGQADEKVPLLLTSYAKDGGGDTRSVTLQLYHYDEGDNPTVLKAEFKIIQYNALIVDIGDDYGKRGFSRRDWNEGQKIGWGYPNTSVFNIMGTSAYAWYNGNDNLNKAKTRNHDGEFYSSAIYYCARKFVTVTNSQKITSTNWFLPARYELYYFLDAHKSTEGEYWSSSPYGNSRVYINYIKNGEVEYPANMNDWYSYTKERINTYKMRPACEL